MPVYTYTPNIPAATDQISQSQPVLQQNNNAIQELVEVNHVGFNTADFGKHKFVTFPQQVVDPTVSATPTEVMAYNFQQPLTGINELWIRTANNTQGNSYSYPITGSVLSVDEAPALGTNGWAYLPSGILLKWGRATGLVNGANSVSLGAVSGMNGPAFTAIMNIQLTAISGGATTFLDVTGVNLGVAPQTISIEKQGTSSACYYFIIGA